MISHDEEAAAAAALNFCRLNGIKFPELIFDPSKPTLRVLRYGVYWRSTQRIVVHTSYCFSPLNQGARATTELKPGRSLSYPGYTHDLTVLGVTCHELGHHVSEILGWDKVRKLMYTLQMTLEPPTGAAAAHDLQERFAEAVMVFVTNPDLLHAVGPKAYSALKSELGLLSHETRPWRDVIGNSPRHVQAIEERIGSV